MELPPLYKYLDVQGATLTLQNRTFKHAKPSTFNDVEDLTIRSIFPEDDETALKILQQGLVDVLVKYHDEPSTTLLFSMRAKIAVFQKIFKTHPGLPEVIKKQIANGEGSKIFTLEQMKSLNRNYVAEVNRFLQDWRILCVSILNDSELMWSRYAQDHQGVVLRIVPNEEMDSKFQKFAPVTYRAKRPALFESAAGYLEESLFGDQDARMKKSLNTIIYSKTLNWQPENEYRLAIPLGTGEKDWNVLPYHPEEVAELYLGAKASDEFKAGIVTLARTVNPQIKVFEMSHSADGKLASRSLPHFD